MSEVVNHFNTPKEIADLTIEQGAEKANQGVVDILISAFLAGAYVAMAAEASTVVGHDMAKYLGYGMAKFMTGTVFSLGLILVVICGSSLFTGNTLISMAWLSKRTTFRKMMRNWGWVFLGNLIGSLVVAYIMYLTNLWNGNDNLIGASALKTAYAKVNLTFSEAFWRGVMCNWFVCLGVWAMAAAKDIAGKVAVCFFIIMAFVASGFEHVVANMYYIPMGLFLKGEAAVVGTAHLEGVLTSLTWWTMIWKNFLPVFLGNAVGGGFFVGALYWLWFKRKAKGVQTPVQGAPVGIQRGI
jgi:formate/nitrite transporter